MDKETQKMCRAGSEVIKFLLYLEAKDKSTQDNMQEKLLKLKKSVKASNLDKLQYRRHYLIRY